MEKTKTTMPIYLFSNTKKLDFHTLIQSHSEIELVEEILAEKKLYLCENNHFTVFSRVKGKRLFVGIMCYASELNSLSKRYYFVDRAKGQTPTLITLVLEMPLDQKIFISKDLISDVVDMTFKRGLWLENYFREPLELALEITSIDQPKLKKRFKCSKKYDSIEKMLYCFNYKLFKSKRGTNLTYTTSSKYESIMPQKYHDMAILEKLKNMKKINSIMITETKEKGEKK